MSPLIVGDCVEAMATMEAAIVDAIVTDPPYGLGFMGKEWDTIGDTGRGSRARVERATEVTPNGQSHSTSAGPYLAVGVDSLRSAGKPYQAWTEAWATEALRVLKPGGHLLAFGGTRTYHRLVCAIEDAGFEIRDTIAWMYGSGFPKSLDVGKAIDKAAGAEREVIGAHPAAAKRTSGTTTQSGWATPSRCNELTAPATPGAAAWQGWGTALKPAHEPIVVARKPLDGTVAANVLRHGTGAINVDGCRIGTDEICAHGGGVNGEGRTYAMGAGIPALEAGANPHTGRWPANVVLDEEAARLLDEQTGTLTGPASYTRGEGNERREGRAYGAGSGVPRIDTVNGYGDSGGASRFFYVAKASSAERNAGLGGFDASDARNYAGGPLNRPEHASTDGIQRTGQRMARANVHPTVKPIALMRWLVRLVTPPGGLVLDPFAGSGTTGCAAVLEGFDFVGIEREAEYAAIAEARIAWWSRHPDGMQLVKRLELEKERTVVAESGQAVLFGEVT